MTKIAKVLEQLRAALADEEAREIASKTPAPPESPEGEKAPKIEKQTAKTA